jgi:hypothetical protein
MPSAAQTDLPDGSLPIKPLMDAIPVRPAETISAADLKDDRSRGRRRPLWKRGPAALFRFLIVVGIGVAATLAWQAYGDTARETIANMFPQLAWLAPQAAPAAENAADPTASAAASADQQLNPASIDLDAVRQGVDKIVSSQEQITRTINQLAAGQEQMARDIGKLQAIEQYILYKNSEARPAPSPAPGPAPKPAPRPQTPRQP